MVHSHTTPHFIYNIWQISLYVESESFLFSAYILIISKALSIDILFRIHSVQLLFKVTKLPRYLCIRLFHNRFSKDYTNTASILPNSLNFYLLSFLCLSSFRTFFPLLKYSALPIIHYSLSPDPTNTAWLSANVIVINYLFFVLSPHTIRTKNKGKNEEVSLPFIKAYSSIFQYKYWVILETNNTPVYLLFKYSSFPLHRHP